MARSERVLPPANPDARWARRVETAYSSVKAGNGLEEAVRGAIDALTGEDARRWFDFVVEESGGLVDIVANLDVALLLDTASIQRLVSLLSSDLSALRATLALTFGRTDVFVSLIRANGHLFESQFGPAGTTDVWRLQQVSLPPQLAELPASERERLFASLSREHEEYERAAQLFGSTIRGEDGAVETGRSLVLARFGAAVLAAAAITAVVASQQNDLPGYEPPSDNGGPRDTASLLGSALEAHRLLVRISNGHGWEALWKSPVPREDLLEAMEKGTADANRRFPDDWGVQRLTVEVTELKDLGFSWKGIVVLVTRPNGQKILRFEDKSELYLPQIDTGTMEADDQQVIDSERALDVRSTDAKSLARPPDEATTASNQGVATPHPQTIRPTATTAILGVGEPKLSERYRVVPVDSIDVEFAHRLLRETETLIGTARHIIDTRTDIADETRDGIESDLAEFVKAFERPGGPVASVLRAYQTQVAAFVAKYSGAAEALANSEHPDAKATAALVQAIAEAPADPEEAGASLADALAEIAGRSEEVPHGESADRTADALWSRAAKWGAAGAGAGALGTFVLAVVSTLGLGPLTAVVVSLTTAAIAATGILFDSGGARTSGPRNK